MRAIKTAVLGVGGRARSYIDAIRKNNQFELVALSDPDPALVRSCSDTYAVRGYQDCRSLIVETAQHGSELLLIFLGPPQAKEFVRLAVERSLPTLTQNPFVRTVAEGLELVGPDDEQHPPLVVSQRWRHDPGLTHLGELTGGAAATWLASVVAHGSDRPAAGGGDRGTSGGGVLLYAGLPWIEWLTRLFGIPKRVYAECTVAPPPGQPRNYDTEDVAALTLRFAHDSIATVSLRRGGPSSAPRVTLAGVDRTIELRDDEIVLIHPDGQNDVWPVGPANPIVDEIRTVGRRLREGRLDTVTNLVEHFAALSVVEAAYLSMQTGSPESPPEFMS